MMQERKRKILKVGARQIDDYACIPACVVAALHYYDVSKLTQQDLKQAIINTSAFSGGNQWPSGSTFGNYKNIIENESFTTLLKSSWPLVEDEPKKTQNTRILERGRQLIDEGDLLLVVVYKSQQEVHCHVIYGIDAEVHFWDPASAQVSSCPLKKYSRSMVGDAMSIGLEKS